ncbi:G/U mismatch-specific DNA glycosylase [Caballeronia sp. LZ065]|nr:G/U mismatch-specific DNA glycosylase [Caballeronia sp. LZ065]MDR5782885.1 G/U mismatch-specific DNA glycosylase [Caballeronia sp. LZ065]
MQSLPDILEPGLNVVFCGINPGLLAASTGHHFAGRGNRFWQTVHLAGFTPELLRPEDGRAILQYGCGLTTAVARPTARADGLSRDEIAGAAASFELKMRGLSPRTIAFLGKMALSAMTGQREIAWGPQQRGIGASRVWVLPNPSGLNRAFSLDALVRAYRELRLAVA